MSFNELKFSFAGLKDIEIISQCMIFFVAGFQTTASTLSFFAHSIATNPDIQEKLCQEIEEKLGQVRIFIDSNLCSSDFLWVFMSLSIS